MPSPTPVLQIKRGSGAPPNALASGELAIDQTNLVLYVGTPSSGNLSIGGEGVFATKDYVNTLNTASSQALANEVLLLEQADDAEALARQQADAALGLRIDALGNAINYVGTVDGGSLAAPTNLSDLTERDPGDYYKVVSEGYFTWTALATPKFAKIGDAFVKNVNVGDWDHLDHTNVTVSGTTNFIDVQGSQDAGFIIDVDANFKGRVTTAETDISALETRAGNIETDLANEITTRGNEDTLIRADISALQIRAGNIESAATSLETRVSAAEQDIIDEENARIGADNALDLRVTALETSIDGGTY
jgi:hypothetical protein